VERFTVSEHDDPRRRFFPSDAERIANLELSVQQIVHGQEIILNRLDLLSKELTVYKAFLNGVVWIVGGLAALAFVLWQVFSDIHRWK